MTSETLALDDEQLAAVRCVRGPVAIHAGAGTGKTRTITQRIVHAVAAGEYDPSAVLAVTFTTRAAGELRTRLAAQSCGQVQVRTFHSAALRQLRHFYPQVFKKEFPQLIASKSAAVAAAAQTCGLSLSRDELRDTAAEIEWAKVSVLSPDAYRATERLADTAQAAAVYEAYLALMDERNQIDFEDVLLLDLAMLTNYPDVARQVHRQYQHFTVDEFQDVSPVQFELLRAWLGPSQDLCVVGDPAQTIYSFAGATADYLTSFERHFPGARVFELSHSYRCTAEIVAVANAVMRDERPYVRLTSAAGSGPAVETRSYANDAVEAAEVSARVVELLGTGVRPRDIAVLFRTNGQSEAVEAALHAHGVPFAMRGAERFFERPEVKQATLALRAGAAGPVERTVSDAVRDVLRSLGWTPAAPASGAAVRASWESLRVIADLADDFERAHDGSTLADFVSWLISRIDVDDEPTGNAVTVSTIHSAKGLEWDCVFVVGVSDGLLPLTHAKSVQQLSEERRLLYVAVTRARRSLALSWASSRGGVQRSPSRFLSGISAT